MMPLSLLIKTRPLFSSPPRDTRFSAFMALVKIAGFEGLLESDSPLTLFIPTNAAMLKMRKRDLDHLFVDPRALGTFLSRHMIRGSLTTAEVREMHPEEMLCGKRFKIVRGKIEIDGVKILEGDIKHCGNIVHVIDAVLMPIPPMRSGCKPRKC
jgi:transforming growth factor-beta-induced protein